MRKVWVDVTGALTAQDPAGFEHAYVLKALALGDEISFCRFDPGLGYLPVDRAEVHRQLGAEVPLPALHATGARSLAKRAIRALPTRVQPPALRLARRLARSVGALPSSVAGNAAGLTAPFGRADVHLSLASQWQAGERDLLLKLRNDLHLQLLPLRREAPAEASSAAEAWARARMRAHQGPQECLRVALALSFYGASGFEDRLQHLYLSLLREGDACIDIGAHTGRHCIPMACAVGAAGTVAAFEPNPRVAAQLLRRLRELDAGNVQVHQLALSDDAGRAEFVIAVDRPEESGLRERSSYNGPTRTERIEVSLTPLDDLPLPAPRFIKLDTEGAEYKVLLGARRLLERARPVVAFEFGEASYAAYGVDPAEVHRYFSSLGYEVLSILGERLGQEAFSQASRVQAYWDYVACPQGEASEIAAVLLSFNSQ